MPGFLGRAESEGGRSGQGADVGWGMPKYNGEGWGLGWVGHLGALQSDGLSGGRGEGGRCREYLDSSLFFSLWSGMRGGWVSGEM